MTKEPDYRASRGAEAGPGTAASPRVTEIRSMPALKTPFLEASIYVRDGIYAVNEARGLLGLDPVPGGDVPMVYGAQGAVPLPCRLYLRSFNGRQDASMVQIAAAATLAQPRCSSTAQMSPVLRPAIPTAANGQAMAETVSRLMSLHKTMTARR